MADRPGVELRRQVYYEPPSRPTEADFAAAEALRREVELRTLETELLRDARGLPERDRQVEVSVDR